MRITFSGCHVNLVSLALLFALCRAELVAMTPVIKSVTPRGVERGKKTVLLVEGAKLEETKFIVFEDTTLKGAIVSVDPFSGPDKSERADNSQSRVRMEVDVNASARPGLHRFRLITRDGITGLSALMVERFLEIGELEPNDSDEPQAISIPATLVGEVSDPADIDCFLFDAKTGQEVVFETFAQGIGSSLDLALEILDDEGHLMQRAESKDGQDPALGYRFTRSGKFRLRVSDLQHRGGSGLFYRINLGELPLITRYFPAGVSVDSTTKINVEGFNVDMNSIQVTAPRGERDGTVFTHIPKTRKGEVINALSLILTSGKNVSDQEPNNSVEHAQMLTLPATVEGRISGDRSSSDVDWFGFTATRGQKLSLEVVSSRVGSPLDSVIEVFDERGLEIRRATVRCTQETTTILGVGSKGDQLSFASTSGIVANDFVMIDREVGQVVAMSSGCETNVRVRNLNGQRFPLWETTAETHAGGVPAYKVDVFPGEADLPPNGLPIFYITARNDDGGPFYGKDSYLSLAVPADGRYFAQIKDAREFQGEDFVYRFSIREEAPDFEVSYSPSGLTVARGASAPVTVWIGRKGAFEGEVRIEATDLPDGVSAQPAIVPPGQNSAVFLVTASPDAAFCCLKGHMLSLKGHASVNGTRMSRQAKSLDPFPMMVVVDQPYLKVTVSPQKLVIRPGEIEEIKVNVERLRRFDGDISVVVRNLPPGVMVDPSMVNFELGNSIPKGQNSLTLRLVAAASTRTTVQPVYVVASSAQLNFNHPTGIPEVAALPLQLAVAKAQMGP